MAKSTVPVLESGAEFQFPKSYVDWAAIIAGAILASAISVVLFQFGAAIGLSAANAMTETGLRSALSAWASGIWIVWVTLVSAMAGGYLAGRMRPRMGDASEHEVEMRDGAHGLLVWALSTLMAAAGFGLLALVASIGATEVSGELDSAALQALDVARKSGIVFAFATGTASVLAAALSWWLATIGGNHRDNGVDVHTLVPAMFRRTA